jgi:hypothetical protein
LGIIDFCLLEESLSISISHFGLLGFAKTSGEFYDINFRANLSFINNMKPNISHREIAQVLGAYWER